MGSARIATRASAFLASVVFLATNEFSSHNHGFLAEAAFQDGIVGSSFRFGDSDSDRDSDRVVGNPIRRWSRDRTEHQRSRNLQASGSDGSTSAKDSCEAARAKEEASIAPGGGNSKCTCEKTELDERYSEFLDLTDQAVVYELSCVDQRCSYCSSDGTTCDRFSYGALFEEMRILDGASIEDVVAQVGYFETNQYIVGRPEAVVYTEYNDPTAPGSHSCSMEIDGLRCAVCEYVNCIGEGDDARQAGMDVYYGMNVVCSNILIGDGDGGYVSASDFETCDSAQLEAIGGSQGVFEMYDPDYGQCFTSVEGCERDKDEMEQTGYYSCQCTDDLHTDGASPFLQNVHLRCEKLPSSSSGDANDVCEGSTDTIDRTYSSYVTETNNRSIEKSGSTVTIEEYDCLTTKGAGDGCRMCKASIDGSMCDSCEMLSCGRILAPVVSCGNLLSDRQTPIDLCRQDSVAGTPFEAFQCGFGEASKVPLIPVEKPTEPPSTPNIFVSEQPPSQSQGGGGGGPEPVSMMACRVKQREFAQRTNNYIDSAAMNCECLLIDEVGRVDQGSLLSCSTFGGTCKEDNDDNDNDGSSICNGVYANTLGNEINLDADEGSCFREELVQGFLPDGNISPMTRTTTYTKGSSLGNSMVGRTLVLTEYGGGSDSCQLLLDGVECRSCQLEFCGSNLGYRPLVDCTNVIDDPSFLLEECADVETYTEGFLLRLAADSSANGGSPSTDFRTCNQDSAVVQVQPPVTDDGGSNNSSNNNNGSSNYIIDPSLPFTCQKAQPIVLPTQMDDPANIKTTKDLTNPNSNFALVSFVSSTKNLPPPTVEASPSCAGEGSDSPGLWYTLTGNDKGIHASVCREATDFEARISVYEGSCNSGGGGGGTSFDTEIDTTLLGCVVGTIPTTSSDTSGSPCNVHWFAEQGKTYYVRVHGSDPTQTGTFNLFLETLDEEVTDNCYSDVDGEYDQACLSCDNAREERALQFSSDPSEIDCRCMENPSTGGYHLTCVDLTCLKCNQKQNTCGFGTYEMEIQRSGRTPHSSYESFYFLTEAEGIQANEVVSIQASECLDIRDPYQQCLYALEETMAGSDEVFCECRETSTVGDHILLCSIYDTHEYCTSTSATADRFCGSVLFGQTISQYGSVTSEFRNYKVAADKTKPEETSITVERSGDTCAVSIGSETCSSCRVLQTCVNNPQEDDVLNIVNEQSGTTTTAVAVFTDLSIDCSDLISDASDASFDCGQGQQNTGLLSILSGTVSPTAEADASAVVIKSQQTIPPDAFPPTSPPVTRPTNPPNEPVAAPSMPPVLVTPTVYDLANPDDFNHNNVTEDDESGSTASDANKGAEKSSSSSAVRTTAASCLASMATLAASVVLVVLL